MKLFLPFFALLFMINTTFANNSFDYRELSEARKLISELLRDDYYAASKKDITHLEYANKCIGYVPGAENNAQKYVLYGYAMDAFAKVGMYEEILGCWDEMVSLRDSNKSDSANTVETTWNTSYSSNNSQDISELSSAFRDIKFSNGADAEKFLKYLIKECPNLLKKRDLKMCYVLLLGRDNAYRMTNDRQLQEQVNEFFKYYGLMLESPGLSYEDVLPCEYIKQAEQELLSDKPNWKLVLNSFSKSKDTDYTILATKELKKNKTPEESLELADTYWEIAGLKKDKVEIAYKSRAVVYYQDALPALDGFKKVIILNRIKEINPQIKIQGASKNSFSSSKKEDLEKCKELLSRLTSLIEDYKKRMVTLETYKRKHGSSYSWDYSQYQDGYSKIEKIHQDIIKITNEDAAFEDFLRRVKIDVDDLRKNLRGSSRTIKESEKGLYGVVRSLESLRFKVRTVLIPRIKTKK